MCTGQVKKKTISVITLEVDVGHRCRLRNCKWVSYTSNTNDGKWTNYTVLTGLF